MGHSGFRLSTVCVLAVLLAAPAVLAERPRVYCVQGAHVVPAPGQVIESGTVVLRDGLIEAVGADVEAPADAVVIDGQGLWVYPGLIDPSVFLGEERSGTSAPSPGGGRPTMGSTRPSSPPGPVHELPLVRPENRASDGLLSFEGSRTRQAERLRELGFTTVLAVPEGGIFRGTSAVVQLLDDTPVSEMILRDNVAQHLSFERGGFGRGYPTSLMGAAATIRQVVLDAERHAEWTKRWTAHPRGMPRPEQATAYEALGELVAGDQKAIFDVSSPDDALLAGRLAAELELDAVIGGSGHEWEVAEQIRASGFDLILPVAFPDKPEVGDDDEALEVTLETMRRYVEASSAAARLHELGVRVALTTDGLKSLAQFRKNVRQMLDAGLPEEAALAAVTTVPAAMVGIDDVAGTLEPGKIANVAIFDGPLFGEDSTAKRVFVDGVEYRVEEKKKPRGGDADAVVDPRGEWSVAFEMPGRSSERTWVIEGATDALAGTAETRSGTVTFDDVRLLGNMLTVVFPAREGRGSVELTVVITGDSFTGSAEFGPRSVPVTGTRTSGPEGGGR